MEEIARKKFQVIFQSKDFQSLQENDLIKLQSYSKLMELVPQKPSRWRQCFYFTAVVFLLAVFLPVAVFTLVQNGHFADVKLFQGFHREASYWLLEGFFGIEFESDECLLQLTEGVEDMFRPPLDCSICRNMTGVERVSGISMTEFEEKFAYSSRPVVITDAMSNWTASETLSFEYLKDIYHNDSDALDRSRRSCQFFPYRTNFGSLRDVFAMSSERARLEDGSKPWYIGWSNCDSLIANTLRQHYSRPYFLPPESESSQTDWIFMGAPGYGAPMHIDNVGLPSWQAQIRGTKRWTLEPPPECYMECHVLEVVVHPGEIIILDTDRWFHQTLIEGSELSITIGSEYD